MKDGAEAAPAFQVLARFDGPPREFWPAFLEAAASLPGCARVALHTRVAGPDGPVWRRVAARAGAAAGAARHAGDLPDALLLEALEHGRADAPAPTPGAAFRIEADPDAGAAVVALQFGDTAARDAGAPAEAALAALVAAYFARRSAAALAGEHALLREALEIAASCHAGDRFLPASLALVNALAARLGAERAALGWFEPGDGIVRLRAVNQAEKFERKTEAVRSLEVAMEECLDQDADVAFPGGGDGAVVRDHERHARLAGAAWVGSFPLRLAGRPVGVLTVERGAGPADAERRLVRLVLDQVAPRLADLAERAQPPWRRLGAAAGRAADALRRPRFTAVKVGALAGMLAVLVFALGRLPYRVAAPFVVRSERVAFITAPFDGYVDEVGVRVGDAVEAGAVLARFDQRELLLRQSAALAGVSRHQLESERHRAAGDLASMRIAQAQLEQARADLEQARDSLARAEVRAPFDGAVIDGELRRRIGAPFRQGDVLFQLARVDELYVEIEVPERAVHELERQRGVTLAFASEPGRSFRAEIEQVHPGGQQRPGGTVFLVRARLVGAPEPGWRPGMTGEARIDVGWRNIAWITMHRTVDWLRLRLWW